MLYTSYTLVAGTYYATGGAEKNVSFWKLVGIDFRGLSEEFYEDNYVSIAINTCNISIVFQR